MLLTQTPLPMSSTEGTANSLTYRYVTLQRLQNNFTDLIHSCTGSCPKAQCFVLRMVLICLMCYCIAILNSARPVWPFSQRLSVQLLFSERSYLRRLHGNRKIGEIQSPDAGKNMTSECRMQYGANFWGSSTGSCSSKIQTQFQKCWEAV